MSTTPDPDLASDAERDSDLYLRGFIDAQELVRRSRERVDPRRPVATSNVPRL